MDIIPLGTLVAIDSDYAAGTKNGDCYFGYVRKVVIEGPEPTYFIQSAPAQDYTQHSRSKLTPVKLCPMDS